MTKAPPDIRQYTLARIVGLWAVAALPMALLAWVITPLLITRVRQPPALVFWLMMIVGMAWQSAVSLWVVYREEGNLSWSTIRHRTWLNAPRDPRTGNPRARLVWWLLPCLFIAFISLGLGILLPPFAPYFLRRSPGNLAGNTASLRLYCGNMGNKAWRKFPIRRHP